MNAKSTIEWTDSTWNPVTGCTKVSPGCDHCYAETIAHRFDGTPAYPDGFKVTLRPERITQPLRWKKPRRVFVNSMSDMFHADIPDEYIARVWAVMALAHHHTFQVLTKRPGRMRSLLTSSAFRATVRQSAVGMTPGWTPACSYWPLPNVWLGVSAGDQRWADVRIPVLLDTPAVVRFVSAEPILGPIKFDFIHWGTLDWVIVGGESGAGARPMRPGWARDIRDRCRDAEVPFHFKQWGAHGPDGIRRSKHANGRELDGRTWDEQPLGTDHG